MHLVAARGLPFGTGVVLVALEETASLGLKVLGLVALFLLQDQRLARKRGFLPSALVLEKFAAPHAVFGLTLGGISLARSVFPAIDVRIVVEKLLRVGILVEVREVRVVLFVRGSCLFVMHLAHCVFMKTLLG